MPVCLCIITYFSAKMVSRIDRHLFLFRCLYMLYAIWKVYMNACVHATRMYVLMVICYRYIFFSFLKIVIMRCTNV